MKSEKLAPSSASSGPSSHIYFSQRLRLHYVDWGNPDGPPMLLIHGGRDHCRNWDWVAEHFAKDYHIIAPDLRGHGDSQWEASGNYTQISYVYDIAQLLQQKNMHDVTVIGHSLGGAIALMYTALFPERVKKLVAIEGMGPSPSLAAKQAEISINDRVRSWVDDMRKLSGRLPRRYDTLDDAFKRMRDENPHLSEEQARHLTLHGANQNEDGTYSWKFDNYVRVFSMSGLPNEEVKKMYGEISCPTLLMRGEESWASDPVADGRTQCFNCPIEYQSFANAGHWVHHDQLDGFVDRVSEFLGK
ncbi:MAG TPA: alpha/beta hydrolase [Gammaproteobacteria bacterium]|jgi:pimeloyl-ACP methyl ester carboxylesterase|uniref:Alpha/beta hydrolase n=2 Tax=OM182 clade TaxID=745002 RepID=A0A0R2S9B1_9GAMM|nr:MAG: alpha/beta hydrolase [OM182 bacterium BACL3 MAG-120507-bin80]KRO82287.1 MAG: alpha/beta hydrolase [OM182 bacterium BACL3 MAG-120619-bin3]MBT5908119.1 alpha/beta hydrolase [Gammaproteobacteria bacterium]MDA9367536.1 alpha/beta hydrolase [bacterium]MBT7763641.1 alpha/beta hydrolase [Gammaproteobacteria bacterium]